ncbi:MAG: hypothetical protein N4A68_00490 [Maledivibacter sp.]|jgi:hypothetical protein|nr:hypothetical protein [Maledivibacter sp.]
MIKEIIELFLGEKWKSVYTTQDVEEYAKIKGKLMNENIKVKTRMNNRYTSSRRRQTTYNILVKSEEVYKANNIIHYQRREK